MKKILELEEVLFENISVVLSVDLMFGFRWAGCREERTKTSWGTAGREDSRKITTAARVPTVHKLWDFSSAAFLLLISDSLIVLRNTNAEVCLALLFLFWNFKKLIFLSIFYWLCCYSCPNFLLLHPSTWYLLSLQQSPLPLSSQPRVVHKFFGFSLSYTVLNLPLFCSHQWCFLIPELFPLSSPFPHSANNPPNDSHVYDSVPVLAVCLVCFCFCFSDSIVDSSEFVVILMFIVLIFF